jgi:hypothetical protein
MFGFCCCSATSEVDRQSTEIPSQKPMSPLPQTQDVNYGDAPNAAQPAAVAALAQKTASLVAATPSTEQPSLQEKAIEEKRDEQEGIYQNATSPVPVKDSSPPYATSNAGAPNGSLLKEMTVTLIKRTDADKIGMDVTFSRNQGLIVKEIKHGQLTYEWNLANPDMVIGPGDEIVEANQMRKNSRKMLDICVQDKTVQLVIQRKKDQ